MNLGSIIAQKRQEKGLSQKQLADLLGIATGTIAEWESGEASPDLDQLQFISTIFKTDFKQYSDFSDRKEQFIDNLDKENGKQSHFKKNAKRNRLIAGIIGVLFFLSIVACAVWFIAYRGQNEEEKVIPFSDDPAAIEVAEKSVVKLNCYNSKDVLVSTGSGVCLFEPGIIVTNYHVVDKISKVEIITSDDDHFITDQVVAYDKDRDIVFLKTTDNLTLTPLQIGDETIIKKGAKVVTISSPIGITNSVSTGVFSGTIIEEYMRILQFTAPISHGSSGGALFNDKGEVIGITYGAYESGQNLNLAVPVSEIERIYMSKGDELLKLSDIFTLTPLESLMELLSDKTQIEIDYSDFRDQFMYLSPRNVYFVSAYNSSSFVSDSFRSVILTFSDYAEIGKERKIIRDWGYFYGHVNKIYEDGFFEYETSKMSASKIKSCDKCIIICSPDNNHNRIIVYGILNLETNELISIY